MISQADGSRQSFPYRAQYRNGPLAAAVLRPYIQYRPTSWTLFTHARGRIRLPYIADGSHGSRGGKNAGAVKTWRENAACSCNGPAPPYCARNCTINSRRLPRLQESDFGHTRGGKGLERGEGEAAAVSLLRGARGPD